MKDSIAAKRVLGTVCMMVLMTSSQACAGVKAVEGTIKVFRGTPKLDMQQVFGGERFPNVVVATDGTVLATWGSASLRVRRSEDGGESWGDTITVGRGIQAGGAIVDEASGDVLVFVEAGHPPASLTVYRSKDSGKTWSVQEVTIRPDANGNIPSMHMNEHGSTLHYGKHPGRLIRPARHYGKSNSRENWPTHYTTAIYSDDAARHGIQVSPLRKRQPVRLVSSSCPTADCTTTPAAIGTSTSPPSGAAKPGATTAEKRGETGRLSRSCRTDRRIQPTAAWVD